MAAYGRGCILSRPAYHTQVPYSQLWLRVEEATFRAAPLQLLPKLREISDDEIALRREAILRYGADVLYSPRSVSPTSAATSPPSRAATNFLLSASNGCLQANSPR